MWRWWTAWRAHYHHWRWRWALLVFQVGDLNKENNDSNNECYHNACTKSQCQPRHLYSSRFLLRARRYAHGHDLRLLGCLLFFLQERELMRLLLFIAWHAWKRKVVTVFDGLSLLFSYSWLRRTIVFILSQASRLGTFLIGKLRIITWPRNLQIST